MARKLEMILSLGLALSPLSCGTSNERLSNPTLEECSSDIPCGYKLPVECHKFYAFEEEVEEGLYCVMCNKIGEFTGAMPCDLIDDSGVPIT